MSPGDPGWVPLVLAAGASSRMGSPKAAARFGERTALELILAACAGAGLPAAIVVAGADPDAVRAAAGARQPAPRIVDNPRWAEGRTTSIQAGLAALPADAPGVLLWPVDACLVGAAVVRALLAARARAAGLGDATAAWVPSHAGRRGHPVLLGADALARLAALGPDQPAREVIRSLAAAGRVEHVETDDPAVLMNMNTPADYARWLAEWERRISLG